MKSQLTFPMATLIKIGLLLLLLLFPLVEAGSQQWVLENVSVLDVAAGKQMSEPQNLYISQGRILKMTPADLPGAYTGFERVDLSGKYVIPGMWDMHAHPDDPEVWRMSPVPAQRDLLLPQFVLQGVTGIRDMAGSLSEVQRWRQLGEQGVLLVPEIVACGPLLDGPNPMWDGSLGIADSSRVRPIVDSLILAGADFLKVYSLLPAEIYLPLAAYAKKVDFPMVGHVPFEISPTEAANTGMKSQEHLLEILLECSGRSEDIRSGKLDYGALETGLEKYIYRQNLLMETFDSLKFRQLIKVFKENQTWITPTLSMWYKNAWFEQEVVADSALLNTLPQYLRQYWSPEVNDHLKYRYNIDFILLKQRLYEFYQYMVQQLYQAGIMILAGTDMGANPLCFPGIGVHNELEALVSSGISPAHALQTATINPALFLEIDTDYGKCRIR